jgi:hypothetical protein
MTSELHPHSETNFPSARRKRSRAPNWRARQRAKSIRQLMDEYDWANQAETLDPNPHTRAAVAAAYAALDEGQWRAAIEFGVPHLWRPARRRFALDALAGFHNSKPYRYVGTPFKLFDWAMCYRWAHNHRPAAIVGQPETYTFKLAEAQEFARENELLVSVADTFESWRYPGRCALVVWQRGRLGGDGMGHNCWMTPAAGA